MPDQQVPCPVENCIWYTSVDTGCHERGVGRGNCDTYRKVVAFDAYKKALQKIAWEPIGDAEASDHDVMRGMEQIAQAALKLADGGK